jgi:hypothetical protein
LSELAFCGTKTGNSFFWLATTAATLATIEKELH